jgi:hypothetical protein
MITPHNRNPDDERLALEKSEKKASEQQPGSFKDEATKEKVVEVLPIDPQSSAIKGIDPTS